MTSGEYELPIDWSASTLGETAAVVKEKVDPASVPDARYVGLEHIEAHTMKLVGSGRGSDVRSAKTRFTAGDVLYGKLRPYLNKVAQPDFDGICSTDLLVFTESAQLDAGYLAHYLNQLWVAGRAHHLSTGMELPRVDWKRLASLRISYPTSKDGQRAVVRLIDEAKASAGSAATHVSGAHHAIEKFRRAVIFAACSGRLSKEWRATRTGRESVDAILARHEADNQHVAINKRRLKPAPGLRLIGDEFSFPENWAFKPIRELVGNRAILDVQDGNHGELYPRKADFTAASGGDVPYISAENVSDVVLIDQAPRLKHDVAAGLRIGFAQAGDVILTHNATVGRVAVLPEDSPNVVLSTSTTYYRVDPRILSSDYLALYMRSHFFQQQLAAVMEQTTRNQVPVTKQVELSVAVPHLDEQLEILRRVDALLQLASAMGDRLGQASRSIERSSQAVLAKAFRGELTSRGAALEQPPGAGGQAYGAGGFGS